MIIIAITLRIQFKKGCLFRGDKMNQQETADKVISAASVIASITFDACFPAMLCAWTALEISSSSVDICDEIPTTNVSSPSKDDSVQNMVESFRKYSDIEK